MKEIFSRDGFVWWVGVVENRLDPLKLGRCQVRIFGYHTEDKSLLPTSDLPWAMPMQPITSAAVSGKGTTPVGPLEGTWVVGWFLDGLEKQQPLMIGTIGGTTKAPIYKKKTDIEQQSFSKDTSVTTNNYLKDSSGNTVYDGSGNPILLDPKLHTGAITSDLPPLTIDQIQNLMDKIAEKESSSFKGGLQNYSAENTAGYIGKYQFGASALIDLGYVKLGSKNSTLNNPNNWTGKDGITSKEKFFANGEVQESIMFQYLKVNYNRLKNTKVISANESTTNVAGYLASAHLVGSGNANKFTKKDGNGTRAGTYFSIGNLAVGGDGSLPSEYAEVANRQTNIPGNPNNPNNITTSSLNNPLLANSKGFEDPNKVYPTNEYTGTIDTNKLAIGDSTHQSLKTKNVNRTLRIPIAVSNDFWDEPEPAYCGKYPYNHVLETEAGHIVEFDSTPGKERINVFHKSGSYIEVDVNGSMIRKVSGDNYEVLERNNSVYVRGGYNLTVDGATNIFVRDNANIQVEGDASIYAHNNMNLAAAKNFVVSADTIALSAKSGMTIITEGEFGLQSKTTNIKASSAINLDSSRNTSIHGKIALALDAGIIRQKMGHTAVQSLGSAVQPIAERSPDLTDLPLLKVPVCDPRTFAFDELDPGALAYKQERLSNGEITSEVPNESATSNKQANNKTGQACECEEFRNYIDFPDTIKLSKYFSLGTLTNRAPASNVPLQATRGLTKAQIACNLKNLAVNVLDPIKAKYSDMIITSCFRISEGDHGIGLAADLQFIKTGYNRYFDIAQWIRDNIPYKQLLLEYETRRGGQISWIHIAYDINNKKANMPIGTLLNHVTYKPNSLVNLA